MKNRLVAIALATCATGVIAAAVAYAQHVTAASTAVQVATRADNFRLVDQFSKGHDLYYYKDSPAVVIITARNGSKVIRDAAGAIQELHSNLKAKNVPVFLLNSHLGDDRNVSASELASLGLKLPMLMDEAQLVGESLGASREGQAFVVDPKTWKIVYSGPIDDRFASSATQPAAKVKTAYVADAVEHLIKGETVKVSSAALATPEISFPERGRAADFAKISYETEVAPIIAKNCVSCHSQGSIAPFAFDSYEALKNFAPMVREALRTDRMPPFDADRHIGTFTDDGNLSLADTKTLVHWIEAGAPRGTGSDPLKTNAKVAAEWELGPPDAIVELPPYTVPASGLVDYQNPVVKNPMTEGRWLRAFTVKPGDRKTVHHLLSNGVVGYAVGQESQQFTPGTGTYMDPKTDFEFQVHYTPYGREVVDKSRVGLYFYPKDKPPEINLRYTAVADVNIEIPAGKGPHEEIAYITFPENATLHTISPHAHYRGASMMYSILEPGSKVEKQILSIPRYDFNWQRGYNFAEPLKIKAGTKLIGRYTFDNSTKNPANPDPTIDVFWGEQSPQEMLFFDFFYRWDDETVSNNKDEYSKRLEASRSMGMFDSNIDDRIEKSELRGPIGGQLLAEFDGLDVNKDTYIDHAEFAAVTRMLSRNIETSRD